MRTGKRIPRPVKNPRSRCARDCSKRDFTRLTVFRVRLWTGLLTVSQGPNEFVPIRNIAQCATIYALTAAEVLR